MSFFIFDYFRSLLIGNKGFDIYIDDDFIGRRYDCKFFIEY